MARLSPARRAIPDAVWRACRLKAVHAESAAVTRRDGAVVRGIVPAAILAEPGRAILCRPFLASMVRRGVGAASVIAPLPAAPVGGLPNAGRRSSSRRWPKKCADCAFRLTG